MIKTKNDLKTYLATDISNMEECKGKNMFIEYLKGNLRAVSIYRFICILRKAEYYENNRTSIINKFLYLIYKHKLQKSQLKTQIFIHTNVFGPGLNIVHPGFCWADQTSSVGSNCTILPRVLLGKKKPDVKGIAIKIGSNCYIGTGSTILGPIVIGNNVTIAANSLINSDIPDNCIVGGVPAKIIKYKSDV